MLHNQKIVENRYEETEAGDKVLELSFEDGTKFRVVVRGEAQFQRYDPESMRWGLIHPGNLR